MSKNKQLHYYFLQQHYFTGLASIIGLTLMSLYFLFGVAPSRIMLVPMLLLYVPLLVWQYLIQRWLQRFYVNPAAESGLHLKGMLVGIAAWPIYFLAFVGAVRGQHLVFKVTPKGTFPPVRTDMRLFIPHLVIGTLAAIDLLAAGTLHHQNPVMIFWATLTALTMYGIAFNEQLIASYKFMQKILTTEVRIPAFSRNGIAE
jgi:hypothetical protein